MEILNPRRFLIQPAGIVNGFHLMDISCFPALPGARGRLPIQTIVSARVSGKSRGTFGGEKNLALHSKNAMAYKDYIGTVEYSEEDTCLFGRIVGGFRRFGGTGFVSGLQFSVYLQGDVGSVDHVYRGRLFLGKIGRERKRKTAMGHRPRAAGVGTAGFDDTRAEHQDLAIVFG